MKILELFGGIGACSKALERLGIDYKIADYVEIDKYAAMSFNAMHGTNFESQDVTTWDKDMEVDLIIHGSPCQDFSLAGKQAGGDKDSGTRSSLMYETVRIVEKLKPKYVIWENVKNVVSKKHKHNFDNYCNRMSELGYTNYAQILNAKNYGIPQNRERVFTVSIRKDLNKTFEFPQKQELKLKLKDMLEDEVDEKYYLSEKMMNYVLDNNDVQKGTKWEGRADNDILNSNIAYALSVRGAAGLQRDGVSNFIVDGEDKEVKVKDLKLRIKNNTKKGYLEATDGDGIDLSQPNSTTRRGRVQKEMIQTLDTQCDSGVVVLGNYSPSNHNASRIVDNDGLAPTVMENHGTVTATNVSNLRIRKLTPKECWRLMGFDDEDYEKASKVCSNTQLYKQAGNSIVVNVLEEILRKLL